MTSPAMISPEQMTPMQQPEELPWYDQIADYLGNIASEAALKEQAKRDFIDSLDLSMQLEVAKAEHFMSIAQDALFDDAAYEKLDKQELARAGAMLENPWSWAAQMQKDREVREIQEMQAREDNEPNTTSPKTDNISTFRSRKSATEEKSRIWAA